MSSTRLNALDQALDIAGSLTQVQTMTETDEPNGWGPVISGQTGSAASVSAFLGGVSTISGLTGMTADSVGRFLTVSGAASSGNNGTFLIITFNSSSSVDISNPSGVSPDGNDGSIVWTERNPYRLEDDINYIRTDRQLIKGTVNWYDAIPTYQRPTAVGTNVSANLTNIAGKTLDASAWVVNRLFPAATSALNDGYITISSPGNLKYATSLDRTGVPIWDGADAGNHEATYVEIINPLTENYLIAHGGIADGYRIFGRTRQGTTGVSPNSVEVEFRAVPMGAAVSTSIAYSWDGYQPTTIDLYYGYRERADNLTETAFRTTLVNGLFSDSGAVLDISNLEQVIGVNPGDTNLSTELTNTGAYYVFFNLPDATPSVVEALNTINSQIGDRTYTGSILTSGQTIAASLQALSNNITGSTITRTIERLASDISANTSHTLPGGINYVVDGTFNGHNLFVFTRGILRDPGSVANGDDYSETSTTSITFFTKQKSGDHINYFVKG